MEEGGDVAKNAVASLDIGTVNAAQPALALNIDRIEVRSQLGQLLLAQIPVISERLAELDLSAGAVACSVRLVSGGSG